MIEKVAKDEEHTPRHDAVLGDQANSNGANPSPEQIKGVVEFVRGYIEQVPYYLGRSLDRGRSW